MAIGTAMAGAIALHHARAAAHICLRVARTKAWAYGPLAIADCIWLYIFLAFCRAFLNVTAFISDSGSSYIVLSLKNYGVD